MTSTSKSSPELPNMFDIFWRYRSVDDLEKWFEDYKLNKEERRAANCRQAARALGWMGEIVDLRPSYGFDYDTGKLLATHNKFGEAIQKLLEDFWTEGT